MAFQKGNKLSKGRPKGGLGNERKTCKELAEKLNVDPFEVLLHLTKGDWKALGYDSADKIVGYAKDGSPIFDERISVDLRGNSAKEACKYLYTQLKAIEHSGEIANPYINKSIQELEVLVKEKLKK